MIDGVTLRIEMRFAEERRHHGEKHQQDQPRRIDEQAGGEADIVTMSCA